MDLARREIAVAVLHRGMVATDLTARWGHSDRHQKADETAAMLLERIAELSLETSGTFWHAKGQVLPW